MCPSPRKPRFSVTRDGEPISEEHEDAAIHRPAHPSRWVADPGRPRWRGALPWRASDQRVRGRDTACSMTLALSAATCTPVGRRAITRGSVTYGAEAGAHQLVETGEHDVQKRQVHHRRRLRLAGWLAGRMRWRRLGPACRDWPAAPQDALKFASLPARTSTAAARRLNGDGHANTPGQQARVRAISFTIANVASVN